MIGGPTVWHSAAASALHRIMFKKQRSRARSGQLQCRVGRLIQETLVFVAFVVVSSSFRGDRVY